MFYVCVFVWELATPESNVQCSATRKSTWKHTDRSMMHTTHVHSVQAKELVLMSLHCSFYQSNTCMHAHTLSVNTEWMKGMWCQATESGSFTPQTHTHTLKIQPLFGNAIFFALKGVPHVCARVCFFWMVTTRGLSPAYFFQKPNWQEREQLFNPPSLFPSFAPVRDF